MRNSYSRGSRIDRAERKLSCRPDPHAADELEISFSLIDRMSDLRICGCEAGAEAFDLMYRLFNSPSDPLVVAEFAKKAPALDKRIAAWVKENGEPYNPAHRRPESFPDAKYSLSDLTT
jgi:hypothetical protein